MEQKDKGLSVKSSRTSPFHFPTDLHFQPQRLLTFWKFHLKSVLNFKPKAQMKPQQFSSLISMSH